MQRVNLHARLSIRQVGCPTCCYQVCALDHAKWGTADLDYPSAAQSPAIVMSDPHIQWKSMCYLMSSWRRDRHRQILSELNRIRLSRSHDQGWQGSGLECLPKGQKQKDFLLSTYRVTQRICWQVCHNDKKNELAQTGTKITNSVSHGCQQNAREQSSKLQTSTGSTMPRATEVKGQGPDGMLAVLLITGLRLRLLLTTSL